MGRAFEYRKARKLKRWGNMARTFTKIGKEIEIAVKSGGPDPTANVRLRILIQNAKAENMPKENVERAIKRAVSKDTSDYKEVVYEGYGSTVSLFWWRLRPTTPTARWPVCVCTLTSAAARWARRAAWPSCSSTSVRSSSTFRPAPISRSWN